MEEEEEEDGEEEGGGEWVSGGSRGERQRGTFNNGSNKNNVQLNWLSVEMLFYTEALMKQPRPL